MNQLIGIIAAILIGGMLIKAVVSKISSARESSRIQTALTLIEGMSDSISSFYEGSSDYSKISTQTAIDLKAVPQDAVINGTTIVTPWYSTDQSSTVTIAPGTSPVNYTITLASIPTDACAQVGQSFLKNSASLSANGTSVKDASSLLTACKSQSPATLTIGE